MSWGKIGAEEFIPNFLMISSWIGYSRLNFLGIAEVAEAYERLRESECYKVELDYQFSPDFWLALGYQAVYEYGEYMLTANYAVVKDNAKGFVHSLLVGGGGTYRMCLGREIYRVLHGFEAREDVRKYYHGESYERLFRDLMEAENRLGLTLDDLRITYVRPVDSEPDSFNVVVSLAGRMSGLENYKFGGSVTINLIESGFTEEKFDAIVDAISAECGVYEKGRWYIDCRVKDLEEFGEHIEQVKPYLLAVEI